MRLICLSGADLVKYPILESFIISRSIQRRLFLEGLLENEFEIENGYGWGMLIRKYVLQ
jgi:hypothetical protein